MEGASYYKTNQPSLKNYQATKKQLNYGAQKATGHFLWFLHADSKFTKNIIPVLFSVILVSVDNIQTHLENPFDQVGEDDVEFNVEKFINNLK